MATSTQWQLARGAAERYERVLVPAILGPAARALVDFAAPLAAEPVLDVGCGTGAAARYAAEKVGAAGRVVGVDVNAGMIDVAQSLPVAGAQVEWPVESAYRLPFPEAEFDVALCAQTLQFLDDRPRALAAVHRVLRPGGRVAVSLWCEMAASPYFAALVAAVTQHLGAETAQGLGAAFGLSDLGTIRTLVEGAGFTELRATTVELDLELPELADFVPRHVAATPMAPGFAAASPAQQRAVVAEVASRLDAPASGACPRVPFRTYLVQAAR